MYWSYRRVIGIIRLWFRNLFPAFPSFSKKRKRGYVTSFYGSKFVVFKKKMDLGYYKMKENNVIPFNTYLSVDKF